MIWTEKRELKKVKTRKTEKQTKNKVVYVTASINTCVCCGREIPEGMLICRECEIGMSQKKCTICDRPIAEGEAICSNCRAMIFRSKK